MKIVSQPFFSRFPKWLSQNFRSLKIKFKLFYFVFIFKKNSGSNSLQVIFFYIKFC